MKYICEICGTEFHDTPHKKRKYCSRKCYYDAPTWSKGLTKNTDERVANQARAKYKDVVDKQTLEQLYVQQNMSLKDIGAIYGVSKHVIKRLAKKYGLKRLRDTLDKPTLEKLYLDNGLSTAEIGDMYNCSGSYISSLLSRYDIQSRQHINPAGAVPIKDELSHLYWDKWWSYEQIAEYYEVDITAVPYWFEKFNIPKRSVWETRRGKNWVEPDIDIIVHLYQSEGLGTQSIANLYEGVSKVYIANLLKENGIELRKTGYPNISHYTASDGHRVKSGLEVQVDNWLSNHNLDHVYEPVIQGTPYFADFLVGSTYIEVWGISNNERYEKKRSKKLKVYTKKNLKLISIYPDDFPNLEVLTSLLQGA